MTPASTTMSVAAIAAMLAPSVTYVPRERRGAWTDRRGTKRKRHGQVAVNRAKAKAARAARSASR